MQIYCITQAPPCVEQPKYALDALVGLEFEYDPERIKTLLNDHPYVPLIASCFIPAESQAILAGLRELRRFEALAHWTCFAAIFPFLYLPVWCCEALENERILPS